MPGTTNNNLWFNLNSLLPKPQHLGDLYLDTFLNSLASRGYDLFVVISDSGALPAPQKALEGSGGEWFRVTTSPTITVHDRPGGGTGATRATGGGTATSTRSGPGALNRLTRAAAAAASQQFGLPATAANDDSASDDDNVNNTDLDLAIAASMVWKTNDCFLFYYYCYVMYRFVGRSRCRR